MTGVPRSMSVERTGLRASSKAVAITTAELVHSAVSQRGADILACNDEHGTPPVEWAHFSRRNLEPDNEEIARVADYLDELTR